MIGRPAYVEARRVEGGFEFVLRTNDRLASARVSFASGRPVVQFPHYASDLGITLGDPAADVVMVAEVERLIAEWDGQTEWQAFRRDAR